MTLKQRLDKLMPHFDDDGKLLPNKKMTVKQNPLGGFRASTLCDFEHVVANVISGNEYRIEDLPKRPREVWVEFYGDDSFNAYKKDCAGCKRVRYIKDTGPLEVTDADVDSAFISESIALKLRKPIREVMKSIIQHYENERGK